MRSTQQTKLSLVKLLAEVTPIRELDNRAIGDGTCVPITEKLQSLYFDVVHGKVE